MRASTLFAITVALLMGLGAAVAAKMSGAFNPPPPAAPPPPPAREEVQILVPAHNLFEGFVLQPADVKLRALRPDEEAHYHAHKDQYLPPVAEAVALRVAAKNLEAERPLLKDQLQELAIAEPLAVRLLPNMRAVNLAVPKDQCAGGLIQVGDWVDLLLTSSITGPDGRTVARTANLARSVRVIAKRNILWQVLAPLPEDQPVMFTLEANPYRAALIDFAKSRGRLALAPRSAADGRRMEELRHAALKAGTRSLTNPLSDPDSDEYRDEDQRVEAFSRGDLPIGDADLVRIFGLHTAAPPVAPVTVQMYSGLDHEANVVFADGVMHVENLGVRRPAAAAGGAAAPTGFLFGLPEDAVPKKCNT